jgi:hypothetical protein
LILTIWRMPRELNEMYKLKKAHDRCLCVFNMSIVA